MGEWEWRDGWEQLGRQMDEWTWHMDTEGQERDWGDAEGWNLSINFLVNFSSLFSSSLVVCTCDINTKGLW